MADEKEIKEGDASPEEKTAAEAVAKAENEAKAKGEADAKAKGEADAKAKTEADVKAKEKDDNSVPEKYDFKLPEGSLLDADALKRTADYAKSQGLSKKAAQALVDHASQVLASNAESQQKQLKTTVEGWGEAAKNDKEYGGEKFGKNAELAKRVVDRFGSPELRKGLQDSGFGNHPELVRLLYKVGSAMSEDQLIMPGSKSAATGKNMEDVFYPSTSDKKE